MTETREKYEVETAVVPVMQRQQFTPEQTALIKRVIAPEATDDELQLFIYQCERTGLDPFSRQIYFRKYTNKRTGKADMTILTGIDGYRLIADRTKKYAGNDDPAFSYDGTMPSEHPTAATATVWKLVGNKRCPFTATARWDEYYPGKERGFMWDKMPHLMLGKVAEALALRKAFPMELSGVYIKEEMDQADVIEVEKAEQPRPQTAQTSEKPKVKNNDNSPHWIDDTKTKGAVFAGLKRRGLDHDSACKLLAIDSFHNYTGTVSDFWTELDKALEAA